jgi:hypothetical protein
LFLHTSNKKNPALSFHALSTSTKSAVQCRAEEKWGTSPAPNLREKNEQMVSQQDIKRRKTPHHTGKPLTEAFVFAQHPAAAAGPRC